MIKMDAPSLETAKYYIDHIDFSNIINKMVLHQGWLKTDALQVCQMYRNYLYLHKKYGAQYSLPPSEEIDEFWHNHILDTQQYRADCEKIFGQYLDHYPYLGIDQKTTLNDLESAFAITQQLYHQEFGEQIYQVKTIFSKIISFVKHRLKRQPARVTATS